MSAKSGNKVWIEQAADLFDKFIGQYGEHAVASGDEVYIQPYVDLSLHLIQMHLQGWVDVSFDDLAALSGASALFGYQPHEFGPKYAHLQLSPDQRIAEATGFGYKWKNFKDIEEAWSLLKQAVDAGQTVKGWDWENILFAGYEDAPVVEDRQVFVLADGPGTFVKWFSWKEFNEWAQRVINWNAAEFGQFTERVPVIPQKELALRIIKDLVAWSDQPPEDIQKRHNKATFGLSAIHAYVHEVEDAEEFPNYVVCHGINPQWTLRNSTAIYLERVIQSRLFSDEINAHLRTAAEQYRAAFTTWKAFYTLLGHRVSDAVRNMPARRRAGAELVRCWGAHEKNAVAALKSALKSL